MTTITEKRDGDFMVNKTFQAIGEEKVTNWLTMVSLCLLCLLLKGGYTAWALIIPYCIYKNYILSKERRELTDIVLKCEKFGEVEDN